MMKNILLIFPILASFLVTLFLVPSWIKRAKNAELVGKDVHKINEVRIPEAGGITVLVGFVFGILIYVAIQTFIYNSNSNFAAILSLISVILMVSFIGFVDDILGWKIGLNRRVRLILVLFASIPLMAINAGKSLIYFPFLGLVDLGIIYPLIIIPLGIIGATTTFNFLAGFNGLESGQGIIILSSLSIVAFYTGNSWIAVIGLCMAASLFAFLIYNFFPSKIFPGDSLTYGVGGLIAIMAILGNFERIAVFFFIPYIIETILKIRGGLIKQSFGMPLEDGTLSLRYKKIYGLEHLSIVLLKKIGIKPTEKNVVFSLWTFQIIIILIGLFIFREALFI